ncbi:ABC transporter permease [Aestuariivirga sp.]|uniref:ABC transporter permease n=1 Tax=Aestuariivirga sp. TaxID=2650926 RepID=UPI0039E58BF9
MPDRTKLLQRYGVLAALILLIIFNLIVTPNFATLQTLSVNLTQVCTIVIVGTGMTLVIATGGIDLSVGSLMAIAGALSPMIFMSTLFPISNIYLAVALGIAIPIVVAGIFGLFNAWLITRFSIQPIVATLVLFIAGRGIAQVSTNGNLQVFVVPQFQAVALGRVLGIPFQVWIMLAVVIVAAFVLRRTVLGRQILAVGGNEVAARLTGVPVARVKYFVYGICGLLSGIAGLIVIAMNSAADANLVGQGMELDAIAAVVVGGTLLTGGRATIIGTLLGALVIQLVRYSLLANGVPDAAALVVKAGLIVLAVWLQRQEQA